MDNYIRDIAENGGPEPDQYHDLNKWFKSIMNTIGKENSEEYIRSIWAAYEEEFSIQTMQGFVVNKPHGYAGDFEIIDRIYTKWISPKKHLQKWDNFFHWQDATKAVRNRKKYFIELLKRLDNSSTHMPHILNVGSGPGRDIHEFLKLSPNTRISIECIDMDPKAIRYSRSLLGEDNRISFTCKNIFRHKPNKYYNMIWSAGLFDYLNQNQFIFLISHLYKLLSPKGDLIIGNFSTGNTSREYMEFGEWFLHHRSESELIYLANQAGIAQDKISIDNEETGINLFMHIKK